MAVILIFASFISAITIFYLRDKLEQGRLRIALLKSLILHGCLMAISSEALSLVKALDFIHIFIFWLIISLTNFSVLWLHFRNCFNRKELNNFLIRLKRLDRPSRLSFVAVTAILIISLAICLIAPPNNFDAMTYHMPRVMHWIQNRTVAHYPSHVERQIFMPPGAAYLITPLQILSGGDWYANCVQWMAFLGSILGVSLLTKKLVGEQAQWMSMLMGSTIPMAISQSTTTQTDLLLSLWLVCFAYFFLANSRIDSTSNLGWLAASLSLAIVTKPTAFLFGAPLFLVFCVLLLKNNRQVSDNLERAFLNSFKPCLAVGLGSLVLPLPGWIRNYQAMEDFLGTTDLTTRSEIHSFGELISVFLKNLALNLPIPGFTQLVIFLHEHLLKINIDESRLAFGNPAVPFTTVMMLPSSLLLPSEDNIANPIHSILGVISLISVLGLAFHQEGRKRTELILLGCATLIGYFLFCYLLKWQPWGNRLILPLFFLQCPIIAYYLNDRFSGTKIKWQNRLMALLSIVAIFYALTPVRHPLIALPTHYLSPGFLAHHQSPSILTLSRQEIYYSGTLQALGISHPKKVNQIVDEFQCRNIGFYNEINDWEYPIWVLLNEKTGGNFRFKHIWVTNNTKDLPPEFLDSEVCVVLKGKGKSIQIKPGTLPSEPEHQNNYH
jgi:4-amino-4-deoxy-L-arabinose transferase-like glycosyltransferase